MWRQPAADRYDIAPLGHVTLAVFVGAHGDHGPVGFEADGVVTTPPIETIFRHWLTSHCPLWLDPAATTVPSDRTATVCR